MNRFSVEKLIPNAITATVTKDTLAIDFNFDKIRKYELLYYIMKLYTQSEIDNLINCQKIIIEPPPKNMRVERGHLKKDMKLHSVDSKHKFSVFMRMNERFNENFSIGLIYIPQAPYTLFKK